SDLTGTQIGALQGPARRIGVVGTESRIRPDRPAASQGELERAVTPEAGITALVLMQPLGQGSATTEHPNLEDAATPRAGPGEPGDPATALRQREDGTPARDQRLH